MLFIDNNFDVENITKISSYKDQRHLLSLSSYYNSLFIIYVFPQPPEDLS